MTGRTFNMIIIISKFYSYISSLKDDDSGDHDQEQGSPKDGEKERNEDDDNEQNQAKKKASNFVFKAYIALVFEANRFFLVCRWWFQGQGSTHCSTTTHFGTQGAHRGDQLARRATNRISSRLAASPRYVRMFYKFVILLSRLLLPA